MSRDDKASYYDLELPDGTVVEAQDVTRALLERAALPPYASKCLGTLVERVWRFGAKPRTDTAREAEKVVAEASFLCEALGGVPSFTMRDVARAAHDAGIEIKFSCDDSAARIAELERERDSARMDYVQAHRERDKYRRLYEAEAAAGKALGETHTRATADYIAVTDEADAERDSWRQTAERAQADLDALRTTLETERQAAVATAEELERVRKRLADLHKEQSAANALLATIRDEVGVSAAHEAPAEVVRVKAALRTEYERLDSEIRVGRELRSRIVDLERELAALRHQLQDRESALWAERIKVSEYKDRYRSRRQSEEPAPRGAVVMRWNDTRANWYPIAGINLNDLDTWTHQPPAPGEGEGRT